VSTEYQTLLPQDEQQLSPPGVVPGKWWNRVGAAFLDSLLVGLPVVIVFAATGNYTTGQFSPAQLVSAAALVVYSILMLTYRAGQTVGKGVTNVRVLRADGAPIDVGRATGREVVKAIFALTGILYVISALWAVWHPENKALHDLIAGTRVVMADSSPAA
jgi:uncharacterized RDD family membrane protein YckC